MHRRAKPLLFPQLANRTAHTRSSQPIISRTMIQSPMTRRPDPPTCTTIAAFSPNKSP
jgi:hypothetical protein